MADSRMYLGSGPSNPDLPKSQYDFQNVNNMTARFGRIYPCFLQEVNPDESLTIQAVPEFDFMPMVYPNQAKVTMHIEFWKCAFRNLMKSYKDFIGRVGNHIFPYVARGYNWHTTGSLADYMGVASYQNKPIIDWQSVGTFRHTEPSVRSLSRSFVLNYYTGSEDFPYHVGNGVYNTRCSDSLFNFFSNSRPTSSELSGLPLYSCYLSDILKSNISTSQPYLLFDVLSALSLSKPSSIRIGLLSYIKNSNTPIIMGDTTMSYLRFISDEYSSDINLAASYSDVPVSTYKLVQSESLTLRNRSLYYRYTFCVHLDTRFVQLYNYLQNNGSANRLFIMWQSSDDIFFNSNNIPSSLPVGIEFDSPTPFSMKMNRKQTDTDSFATSTDYYFVSGGLQNTLRYRSETSFNMDSDNSPFVIHSPATMPIKPISVLPFRMYEFIYNMRFRNAELFPFIKNGQPTYNEFLTNDGDGADFTTPLDFYNALYETDIYTTAKYSPQAGNAPLVGISHTPGAGDAIFLMEDENHNTYRMKVTTDSNGTLTGISSYDTNANESTLKNLNTLIQYGISINDFRSVSAYQRFLERVQKAGFDYKSYVKEFFGTNAPVGEEYPEYLGGLDMPVSMSKILNSAQTDVPLGYYAGIGRVQGSMQNAARCYCSERSYVMGLIWFSVTPVYPQSMAKHWFKSDPLDFFNPQFATIGNQPIYNFEVAPLQATSEEELNGVFGYQRPWYEYTMRTDEVHGQFRSTQHNYLLQREFQTVPQLGKDFVSINADDLTNIFSYTEGSDKISGCITFNCTSSSPVPKFITSKIVG